MNLCACDPNVMSPVFARVKNRELGLAPIQRDGLEYEFTVVLDLSIDRHVATLSKDRTGLFGGKFFTPDEETGHCLTAWLQSGKEPKQDIISTINHLLHKLGLVDHAGGTVRQRLAVAKAQALEEVLR